MKRAAIALSLLCAAALPAAAEGHSLVRSGGGVISYLSQDATSLNTLTVRPSGGRIEFFDPTVDGGMDPGSCTPGDVAGGFIVQVFCADSAITRVRLDLGEREDTATVSLTTPATILGGPGADGLSGGGAGDEVSGGDGNDVLAGGDGDDSIDGGAGDDSLDGGPGADGLISRDGLVDTVACGDGADSVDADTLDQIASDCETVSRTPTEAPGGAGGDEPGRPTLDVGAETVQRPGGSRRVKVYATSSEPGAISASGFIDIAGLSVPVKVKSRPVEVGGAGVELTYKIAGKRWERASQALRRGRKVTVRLGVVATDLAGNSSKQDAPRIRLAGGGGGKKKGRPATTALPGTARHPEPGDMDGDEVWDVDDNCPTVKNGSQINTDLGYTATNPPAEDGSSQPMTAGDGDGDACDNDDDADAKPDAQDNCRIDRNPDQIDEVGLDGTPPPDGYGDVCPPIDSDGDGIINDDDNCDFAANPDQQDLDGDDRGDACDADLDGDDFDNRFDNCPTVYNIEPTDTDGDGLINDQLDADGDGIGTACDPDESVIRPPGAPNPDQTPPDGPVNAAKSHTLDQLRAGIIVRVECNEACAATSEVVLDRKTAKRLGLGKKRTIATGSARLDGAGKTYAFSRLDPRAGKALKGRDGVKAKLSTTVVDDAGNARGLSKRIKVRG